MAEAKKLIRAEKAEFPKEPEEMSRQELLDALFLARLSADNGWRIAARLAKEKLLAEKRCLPQFLTFDK